MTRLAATSRTLLVNLEQRVLELERAIEELPLDKALRHRWALITAQVAALREWREANVVDEESA